MTMTMKTKKMKIRKRRRKRKKNPQSYNHLLISLRVAETVKQLRSHSQAI
jgi:hypothetical protein